jgi:hypothetical protein
VLSPVVAVNKTRKSIGLMRVMVLRKTDSTAASTCARDDGLSGKPIAEPRAQHGAAPVAMTEARSPARLVQTESQLNRLAAAARADQANTFLGEHFESAAPFGGGTLLLHLAEAFRTVLLRVQSSMSGAVRQEFKVLKTVIGANAILMMDHLFGSKEASKSPFHNETVLAHIPECIRVWMVGRLDQDIAVCRNDSPGTASRFATAVGRNSFSVHSLEIYANRGVPTRGKTCLN